VTLPAGWAVVDQKDWYIRARLAGKGELFLISGPDPDPATRDAWIQGNITNDQKTDANANVCVGPEEVTLQNGPPAQGYIVCLTVVPQGGDAYEAYDLFNTQIDEKNKIVYELEVWSSKANFDELIDIVRNQVSPTLVWKLYKP
jgi:hypothetical protein